MGGEVCPGESDCFDFQASLGADASLEDKREDACTFCPMLPTKPKDLVRITRGGKDVKAENRIRRIRQIRQERLSGYPRSLCNMSTLDFHGLLILDAGYERFQRHADVMQRDLLEESVSLMTALMQAFTVKA